MLAILSVYSLQYKYTAVPQSDNIIDILEIDAVKTVFLFSKIINPYRINEITGISSNVIAFFFIKQPFLLVLPQGVEPCVHAYKTRPQNHRGQGADLRA